MHPSARGPHLSYVWSPARHSKCPGPQAVVTAAVCGTAPRRTPPQEAESETFCGYVSGPEHFLQSHSLTAVTGTARHTQNHAGNMCVCAHEVQRRPWPWSLGTHLMRPRSEHPRHELSFVGSCSWGLVLQAPWEGDRASSRHWASSWALRGNRQLSPRAVWAPEALPGTAPGRADPFSQKHLI